MHVQVVLSSNIEARITRDKDLDEVQMLWLQEPFAITMLQMQKVDAVLLVPEGRQPWRSLIRSLPVADDCLLNWHPNLYTLGSRMPPERQNLRMALHAYLLRARHSR
jgi:hypothetical protein